MSELERNAGTPPKMGAAAPVSDEPSARNTASPRGVVRRQLVLLGTACGAALVLCLLLSASDRAAHGALAMHSVRAEKLAADARAIVRLRALPRQAVETGWRQGDLLERVMAAMQAAGLRAEALISTLPQPPRKLPGTEQMEVVHRLVFEEIGLAPLLTGCRQLVVDNPGLRVSGLQLRAGRERQTWNAEVSLSYRVLAPPEQP